MVLAIFFCTAFPCTANIQDFAGILVAGDMQKIESLIDEVNVQRGWTVIVLTYSSGIPQISLNAENWLTAGQKRLIFLMPTSGYQPGEKPSIKISSDLAAYITQAKINKIVGKRMMPDFQKHNYSESIIKGLEALLIFGINIQEVEFENNYPISGTSSPHWSINATDEVVSHPICFSIGSVIKMMPVFVNDTPILGSIKIKANVKGVDYIVDGISSDGQITTDENGIEFKADLFVGYEENILIKWYISFDDFDWALVGESSHKVFFTLGNPSNSEFAFSEGADIRYLFFSCNKAKGKSTKAGVLNSIWKGFDIDNPIKIRIGDFLGNGQQDLLKYYGTLETGFSCLAPPYFDGQCTAWSELFAFSLAHQGFKKNIDYKILRVESIYSNDGENLIIKNWQFLNKDPSSPLFNDPRINESFSHKNYSINDFFPATQVDGIPTGSYAWLTGEVLELPGVPGQNNPNPLSDFNYHALVEVISENENNLSENTLYFDPSYGIRHNSIQSIKNMIDGLYIVGSNFETIFINGQNTQAFPFLFRKNIDGNSILIHD